MEQIVENPQPNHLITTNRLDFEVPEHSLYGLQFRIGTCLGLWGSTKDSYYILSVVNKNPGNGHLNDVFEWFEFSCQRDNKNLIVLEIINDSFYKHLLLKRGFVPLDTYGNNCIKIFNEEVYRTLLKKGNSILKSKTLTCR